MINLVFELDSMPPKSRKPKPPLSHRKNISAHASSKLKPQVALAGVSNKEKAEENFILPLLKGSFQPSSKAPLIYGPPAKESNKPKGEISARLSLNGSLERNKHEQGKVAPRPEVSNSTATTMSDSSTTTNRERKLNCLGQEARRPMSQNSKENIYFLDQSQEITRPQRRLHTGILSRPKLEKKPFTLSLKEVCEPDDYPREDLLGFQNEENFRKLKLIVKKESALTFLPEEDLDSRRSMFCVFFLEDILGSFQFFSGEKKKEPDLRIFMKSKLFADLLSELRRTFTTVFLTYSDLLSSESSLEKCLNQRQYEFDAVYRMETSSRSLFFDAAQILKDFKCNKLRKFVMVRCLAFSYEGEVSLENYNDFYGIVPAISQGDPRRISTFLLPKACPMRTFTFKCYEILQSVLKEKFLFRDKLQSQLLEHLVTAIQQRAAIDRERERQLQRVSEVRLRFVPNNNKTAPSNACDNGDLSDLRTRISNYFKFNVDEQKRKSKQYSLYATIGDLVLRNGKVWERVSCKGLHSPGHGVKAPPPKLGALDSETEVPLKDPPLQAEVELFRSAFLERTSVFTKI